MAKWVMVSRERYLEELMHDDIIFHSEVIGDVTFVNGSRRGCGLVTKVSETKEGKNYYILEDKK